MSYSSYQVSPFCHLDYNRLSSVATSFILVVASQFAKWELREAKKGVPNSVSFNQQHEKIGAFSYRFLAKTRDLTQDSNLHVWELFLKEKLFRDIMRTTDEPLEQILKNDKITMFIGPCQVKDVTNLKQYAEYNVLPNFLDENDRKEPFICQVTVSVTLVLHN